jgi:hypothetical protein
MNSDQDCTFQPRLESLEDRFLLSTASAFRNLLPVVAHPSIFAYTGPIHTAAQVPTILNPVGATTYKVSIVPQHDSLGLSDLPSPITVTGFDPGISEPGLRTPSFLANDPGLTIPGLPSYAPSHPATGAPLQSTGFTLSPQGIVTGSLF